MSLQKCALMLMLQIQIIILNHFHLKLKLIINFIIIIYQKIMYDTKMSVGTIMKSPIAPTP